MRTPLGVVSFVCVAVLLGGCVSAQEREARERAELSRRIDEVCKLPAAERDAALEKLKKDSGLVLVCGSEKK